MLILDLQRVNGIHCSKDSIVNYYFAGSGGDNGTNGWSRRRAAWGTGAARIDQYGAEGSSECFKGVVLEVCARKSRVAYQGVR